MSQNKPYVAVIIEGDNEKLNFIAELIVTECVVPVLRLLQGAMELKNSIEEHKEKSWTKKSNESKKPSKKTQPKKLAKSKTSKKPIKKETKLSREPKKLTRKVNEQKKHL